MAVIAASEGCRSLPAGWRQVSLGCAVAAAAGRILASSDPWGSEAVAAAAVAGTPGAMGSRRRGYRGHGQGALERPKLLLAFPSRSRSSVGQGWKHPIWEEGEGGGERDGCGGRGELGGRGRKLQQPRATSITFNFKRERGSWKSTGVAIWQRDGKRRLRGPGSVLEHLWTLQGLLEKGSGVGGGPRRDNSDRVKWAHWG